MHVCIYVECMLSHISLQNTSTPEMMKLLVMYNSKIILGVAVNVAKGMHEKIIT